MVDTIDYGLRKDARSRTRRTVFALGSFSARLGVLIASLVLLLALAVPTQADETGPDELLDAAVFDQKLNAQVPPDLVFQNEMGRSVRLGDYFGTKPVILVLAYYECPNLCGVVVNDLVKNLQEIPFDIGNQFTMVTVSIDPEETPVMAVVKKQSYISSYGRPGAADGWHFLTGDQATIEQLADAVGFRYAYDPKQDQYSHPGGLMVLTPKGTISRYFYGLQYSPTDLRLGLIEASANKIGSTVDQVLLRCYRYDPETATYRFAIMNIVRVSGFATVLALGMFVTVMLRRERRQRTDHHRLQTSESS